MNKYLAAIDNLIAANDPRATAQLLQIENAVRMSLPREKLSQRLEATVRVTENELKREYLKKNQTARVKYVFFDPKEVANSNFEAGQDAIQTYYNEHKEEFRQPEKRQIQYATFPVTPTAEDSVSQYEFAEELLMRLEEGEEFSKLAEIYSEDQGTKTKGGDLGFFKRGAMVKAFEEAAFGADKGETVGPVKSPFGLHIIKVEDKKGSGENLEVKARHILLKFEPSTKTRNRARDNADRMAYEAETGSMEAVASRLGVEIQTSDYFPKGSGFVPGLGPDMRVSNAIFRAQTDEVGDVVQNRQDAYFVYKVVGIQKERIEPLAEVRTTIEEALLSEFQMEKTREQAEAFRTKLRQEGVSLEEAAQQDSLEVKTTDNFNRGGYVSGVGREGEFIGTAFGLQEAGEVSGPVQATRGYYIIELLEKSEFNTDNFNAQKPALREQLISQKRSQIFGLWYAKMREESDIEDNRSRFY
jgi:parvulin-like peptidyl-prolyl isomerase